MKRDPTYPARALAAQVELLLRRERDGYPAHPEEVAALREMARRVREREMEARR